MSSSHHHPRGRAASRILILGLLVFFPGAAPSAQGSAFDELERIRSAYRSLEAFSDGGTILWTSRSPDGAEEQQAANFELVGDGEGGFRFVLQPQASSDQLLWVRDGQAFRFDGDLGQYRGVPSAAVELISMVGEGGQDALVVPLLLLGLPDALPEPEAAALDQGRYRGELANVLTLSSLGGALETELTTDPETALVHRVRVAFRRSPAGGGASLSIEVSHHPQPGASPQGENWNAPPRGAREVAEWQRPEGEEPTAEGVEVAAAEGAFGETVEVALLTYSFRVLTPDGSPVRGLRPEDLRLRLGRKELPVVALDWVAPGSSPAADLPPETLARTGITLPPPGRLVVFFVQAGRTAGHLQQIPHSHRMLESLGRDDRVAVVSFDAHFKLRLDFTRDHRKVKEALAQAIRFDGKIEPLPVGRYPSLARSFDFDAALKAASPERALELTAKALAPLLGDKEIVFVGWGVGSYADGDIRYSRSYFKARDALEVANVTVSVLDISRADFHTLELGLQQVAKDTGGTYERVFQRSRIATKRLVRTLQGRYLVTFENPDPGKTLKRSKLNLRLRGVKGEVILGQPVR